MDKNSSGLIALIQMSWDYIKFYQELLVKVIFSYVTITGAVLAFWIVNPQFKLAFLGLILPIILGISISVVCFYAINQKWPQNSDKCMRDALEGLQLDDYAAPTSGSFVFILWVVGMTASLSSLICSLLILKAAGFLMI